MVARTEQKVLAGASGVPLDALAALAGALDEPADAARTLSGAEVALAGQAALAIDNARLYQQQKQFADTIAVVVIRRVA